MSLAQAQQALETASREHERLAQQRQQVTQRPQAIGHASHVVALQRGVRRHGTLSAADIQAQSPTIRTMAQQATRRQVCLERLAKAERVIPTMQATMAFVSGNASRCASWHCRNPHPTPCMPI